METNSEKMYLASQKMFEEGKIEEGIGVLESIIAKDPNYLLAYCTLGRAYVDKGIYQKAEHILLRAAKLSPKWHLPHLQLGWAYERQQELPQALAVCRRTQCKPEIIRQNVIFVAQRCVHLLVKATKTEKYSGKFFSPTGC